MDASSPSSYAGSGNTWYDLSGNNNHATLVNSPTFDASTGSIVTNGVNQYISIPQISTSTTNVTMQAWVYVNSNTTGTFMKNGTSGGYSIGIGNNAYDQAGSNLVMLVYGVGWISTGVSYNSPGWKLITMTLDGSSVPTAYVNGTLIGSYPNPNHNPAVPSGPLYLGASIGDQGFYYNGKFAAAYFYNRVLTPSEITQNYNAFSSKSTALSSNTITTLVNQSPTINITVNGDGCIHKTSLIATTGLTTYAWYNNNVAISGATSNSYTPTSAGSYTVQVLNGNCNAISSATTINTCGLTADGKMMSISNANSIVSNEGGANFGTGLDNGGSIINTTQLTTTSSSITASSAVLGGVISATNAITSAIGVIYSTDINFGTYSTTTIQSNVTAGTYTSTISGLSSGTNYFTKSFVINNAGTSYGPVINFTTSVPSIVTQGLVLNLDAGNNSSYSSTGTTWTDLSGRGNNGSLVNTVTYNSNNQGSLVFNGYENGIGPNPYVLLPTNSDFDFGTGDFTVDMWVNIKTVNDHPNFLSINVNQSSNFAALRMGYYLGNLGIIHSYDNASWVAQKNIPIATNTWKNIVVSRISGQVTVYIDAISNLTYSLSGSLMASQQNLIGTLSSSFTPIGYFNLSGNIAATKIYKGKGLTSDEVSTQFSLLKTRFGL